MHAHISVLRTFSLAGLWRNPSDHDAEISLIESARTLASCSVVDATSKHRKDLLAETCHVSRAGSPLVVCVLRACLELCQHVPSALMYPRPRVQRFVIFVLANQYIECTPGGCKVEMELAWITESPPPLQCHSLSSPGGVSQFVLPLWCQTHEHGYPRTCAHKVPHCLIPPRPARTLHDVHMFGAQCVWPCLISCSAEPEGRCPPSMPGCDCEVVSGLVWLGGMKSSLTSLTVSQHHARHCCDFIGGCLHHEVRRVVICMAWGVLVHCSIL